MTQKPEEVLKTLKSNQYEPLYFLQGNEPFFIDQIADFIENHALKPEERSFNQTIFYGKDVEMKQIINQAKQFPMMAQRQVIIVKEAQDIADLRTETGKKWLTTYCENPSTSTVLVFCYKNKRLDSRTQFAKKLTQKSVFVDTKKLYDNQLPQKITEIVTQKDYQINPKATRILAEYIGNDLGRIANEIQKLTLNLDKNTAISEQHIMDYIGMNRAFNTFELQDALGERNNLKATQIVQFFANNPKDHPIIPIIALLFSYFSKLLLIHHAKDKTKSALAKKLGVSPYFIANYEKASRNYPLLKTIQIIGLLHQADLQSKGVNSNINEHEILKELVFKILYI